MKLTETQFKKLEQAERAVRLRVGKSILERGLFVDRSMPFSGGHYHKYILYLANGQEINFRDYFMDEFSMSRAMPDIIQTVIKGLDLLTPYVKGKFVNEGPGGSIDMNGCDELFRKSVQGNESLLKLVDCARKAEIENVNFVYMEGNVGVLIGLEPSLEGKRALEEGNVYSIVNNFQFVDHSSSFITLTLKRDFTDEHIQGFLDILVSVVNSFKELNSRYPGKYFKPQVYFKPMKTKTKFVPKEVDSKSGIKKKEEPITYDIDLNVGDQVSHKTFGTGTVTKVDHEKGHVLVSFERSGEKLLSYRIAKLKKI